jgi:hypothetical protein
MAPFWLVFVTLAILTISAVVMAVAVRSDDPASIAPLPTLLLLLAFWAALILLTKPWLGYVRVVHEQPDGSLELTTIFGRKAVLRAGEVTDLREQQLLPQPGSTRVRTRDGTSYCRLVGGFRGL